MALLPMLMLLVALAQSAPAERTAIVFDFECGEQAELGRQLADAVRIRLAKAQGFKVIDALTTAELAPQPLPPSAPDDKLAALLKDKLEPDLAILGTMQKSGQAVRAEVRVLDLKARTSRRQAFSDSTERARGEIARQVVEFLRGQSEWKPPEYGDQAEPKDLGKPLNANGRFDGPDGWQKPDNVSSFFVPDARPGRGGQVLRLFTDLEREAWLKYQQDLRLGKADPANPPRIGTVDNKYATVAGLEGVHFRGEWIEPAQPRMGYWLTADMKGRTAGIFFPKIFVKGFADFAAGADGLSDLSLAERKLSPEQLAAMPPEKRQALVAEDARQHPERYRRQVYEWYLACRNEDGGWKHYAAPFPPRGGLPANVKYLRIDVYAYWPPGEYLFDDVNLYLAPAQSAPTPEEPARTPSKK